MKKRIAAVIGVVAVLGTFTLSRTAFADGDRSSLRASLRGTKEIPGPGDPDGRGQAKVQLRVNSGKVCVQLEWDNIAAPTLGHIHVGAPDVAGPVVVDLLTGSTPDELEADNDFRNCVDADPALVAQIAAHPSDYYVNVHNARFPAGAIRGQLQRS